MARSQAKSDVKRSGRQPSTPKNQGKRPQGIERQRPQRSIGKGARQNETLRQWKENNHKDTEPEHPLPSPSTSNTASRKIPHSSPVFPTAVNSQSCTQKPSPNSGFRGIEQPYSQHGHDSTGKLDRKRKRSQDAEDPASHVQNESVEKRARISLLDRVVGGKEEASDINSKNDLPIEHWRKTGNWPKKLFEPDPNMGPKLTRKRLSSSLSYSQGVRDRIYPVAHTATYEKQILEPAGIILDQQIGEAAIGPDARELCQILLKATYETPKNTLFEGDLFWRVMNGVRNEGEGRVVRDLQPYIVPSAEILSFSGLSKINYLKETIKILWNNVVSLAGPTPCPDLTVGLLPSAFTEPELNKLHRHHNTSDTPSRFTGDLYFPFFTCEAKCGTKGLNESDRQNALSAGTAIKAICGLYQQGEETRRESRAASGIDQLHRKILFFSISHDHTIVKIFGHYPLIREDKTHFHRHLIESFDLTARDGENKWTAYNFIRKLYDHFAPIHLRRIQDAIPYLPEPSSESVIATTSAENESELPDSQEIATSAPASQDKEFMKKPRLTATAMLREQLAQEKEESKQRLAQEKEESRQRHAELMERLVQEKEENKELMSRLKEFLETAKK